MGQIAKTFAMNKDELQPVTLCPDAFGLGVFFPMNFTPVAQGGFGEVYKAFRLIEGRFQSCAVKQIPLLSGDRGPVDEEFARLLSVIPIAGAVTVLQSPVYSATHGYLVTEYVSLQKA